jgi:hypothetical protein
MGACLERKESALVKIESVAVHKEVPKEEAAVKTVRAQKKLYGDRHLAIGRCRQLRKWTQGDGGSRKKLAAARRGMTHRAIPAWHKGHGHRGPGKDIVVQGTQKGRMFRKRCWAKPEWNNSVKEEDLKEQL